MSLEQYSSTGKKDEVQQGAANSALDYSLLFVSVSTARHVTLYSSRFFAGIQLREDIATTAAKGGRHRTM